MIIENDCAKTHSRVFISSSINNFSDATRYGGSGLENGQPMPSGPIYWQSCPHSILLTLPPLATVILKRRPKTTEDEDTGDEASVAKD
jgi:1,4-alpha-glucan branching enzyme